MYKLCRVDIGRGEETYRDIELKLKELAESLRSKYNASEIVVFGSYVRGDLNEGSDIDLLVVGDFQEKFHKRIAAVLDLTDLPLEPLCYREDEFREMLIDDNKFIVDLLKEGVRI